MTISWQCCFNRTLYISWIHHHPFFLDSDSTKIFRGGLLFPTLQPASNNTLSSSSESSPAELTGATIITLDFPLSTVPSPAGFTSPTSSNKSDFLTISGCVLLSELSGVKLRSAESISELFACAEDLRVETSAVQLG